LNILAMVGSPHEEGLTDELVNAAITGVLSAGGTVNKVHASDYDWGPCLDCEGKTCWSDLSCRHSPLPGEMNEALAGCDGLIIAAPVYFLDVNGLTRNLLDRLRPGPEVNGIPALGISMAGGTGKGFVLAAQKIYHFLFCISARPLPMLAVTRFNYQRALEQAEQLGHALATTPKRPFASLAERMAQYHALPLMDLDLVGENLLLVETILAGTQGTDENRDLRRSAEVDYQAARAAFAAGDVPGATQLLEEAYNAATRAWNLAGT